MEEKKDYYVYVYLNQLKPGKWFYKDLIFNYEPFYVGKGRKQRDINHLCPYMLEKKTYKSSTIKSIKNKTGENPIHYRIYENITNNEAIEIEVDFIKTFGRKDNGSGILTNCTDGGDGANNFSEDTKKKIGNKRKKIYQYSLDGKFLKEWDGISSVDVGCDSFSNIATSIKRNGTWCGYIWSFEKKDVVLPKIKYQMPVKYKEIKQINILTGEIIEVFEDTISIEKKLKLRDGARNKIYDCINKKIKTAYGFKWEI